MQHSKKVNKRLDKIIDRVISQVMSDNYPIVTTGSEIYVGDITIVKDDNFYQLRTNTGDPVFSDIYLIESALLLAKCYNEGNTREMKVVKDLEDKYVKHYADVKHYGHTIKVADKHGDVPRAIVAETRYHIAKGEATYIKRRLRNLTNKIVKIDKY